MLYELVTGYQPHVAKNLVELLDLKRRVSPVAPSQRRPDAGIPKAFDALVAKLLNVDPSRRPQSALELCAELSAMLVEKPTKVPASVPRRRGLANTLVAGMSVLVLGIGGAALAKTPAGGRATASLKSAYEQVVKLRADALARRAPPAPGASQGVAIGNAPALDLDLEPVAAPAAPPPPVAAEPAAVMAADESEVAGDEGEVDAQDAPAAADAVASAQEPSDEQEVEVKGAPTEALPAEETVLTRADALWEKGAKLRALALLKRAARKTPNDASVQRALVARAEQTAEWGEAVKAARRWALLDPSSEARLALARLERATGHKERAVALIEGVLKDDPASPDAKTLLGEMRGQKLALSQ